MKIYKISQKVNNNYDTYDSAIVCAENEEDAKTIYPSEFYTRSYYNYKKKCFMDYYANTNDTFEISSSSWTNNLKCIEVKYLGEANEKIKRGVILSSFNGG